jgi:signal transduction histidine kinase
LDQQLLLAAQPPSRLQRRLAYGVMACLVIAFCMTVRHAHLQLPVVPAFVPIYASLIIINGLITATLLLAQFWVVRWTWLLVLASGYLFTALMAVPGVLAFPGVFSPTGALGSGMQGAAWIGACYQFGSPAILIAAVLVRDMHRPTGIIQRKAGLAIALTIALVTAITCGLTWAILRHEEILPPLFVNGVQQSKNIILVVVPILALEATAFLLLWRRGRSVLDLWLMVMCVAWMLERSLSGPFAGGRYSLGWYTGHIFQMAAMFIVLLLLLSEATTLYANMARAHLRRRGGRQTRHIAMDAMAASIGHEIRQPLAALRMNASAGAHLAAKAEPDIREVRAILADIDAEARRIGEIIDGVRIMFRESTHDRRPLDLNTIVQDVLASVTLELHLHHVAIKTDLEHDLPLILADSGQLHQVFLNLITNAIEAMSETADRPHVLTLASTTVPDSSEIAVTVADTGIGIAGKDNDRIFKPFFSTKTAGSGIGLTICQVIIKAHGGRLKVRPNQPYGTVFCVILPRGEGDSGP